MNRKTLTGHLLLLSANLIYGVNYVIAKGVMPEYLSPRAIIFFRVTGTVLLFWLLSLMFPREKVEKRDLFKLAICAFFGVTLNQIMFFEGLNLSTPIDTSIIMTINPILVLVFSFFLIKEKITVFKIAGIILGAAGAITIILSHGEISFSSDTFTGNLLIVINASSFAVYLVLVKPLIMKYRPWTMMKWIFVFGCIMILPVCTGPFIASDFAAIPGKIWVSIIYIIIGTTFIGYLLYNLALERVSPTLASTYMYLQPLIASLTAIIFIGDILTVEAVISAILIFSGVYLVSYRKSVPLRK
ncbi:MAG: EamA family transporter [bacterium]